MQKSHYCEIWQLRVFFNFAEVLLEQLGCKQKCNMQSIRAWKAIFRKKKIRTACGIWPWRGVLLKREKSVAGLENGKTKRRALMERPDGSVTQYYTDPLLSDAKLHRKEREDKVNL